MRRPILVTLAACALVLAPGTTAGQDGPELSTHCLTVVGAAPDGGWDELGIEAAIEAGDVDILSAEPVETCRGEGPDPLEIIDAHALVQFGLGEYVVLVRNPNVAEWSARRQPLIVEVLDEAGGVIESDRPRVSLSPDTSGAIHGFLGRVEGAASLRITPTTDGWAFEADPVALDIVIEDLAISDSPNGPVTTGVLRGMPDGAIGVRVTVVYRDADGEIVGGATAFPEPGADGRTAFEATGSASGDVAMAEVFVEVPG